MQAELGHRDQCTHRVCPMRAPCLPMGSGDLHSSPNSPRKRTVRIAPRYVNIRTVIYGDLTLD